LAIDKYSDHLIVPGLAEEILSEIPPGFAEDCPSRLAARNSLAAIFFRPVRGIFDPVPSCTL
jgi:hypothetical protein